MRRLLSGVAAVLATVVLATAAADAEGVTRVQQSDGAIQVYRHVRITLAGETLRLRSPDRKGVLEIAAGACSMAGAIQRCLPVAVTLHQYGRTHQIALERGTVYLNLSDSVQHLTHSSQPLGPRDVLIHLHTARGTSVSVTGTLDEVK